MSRGSFLWSDRRRCVCQYLFVLYEQLYYEAQKKRLGIYNILGMEKIHIAKIMAWETFFSFLIAAGGGRYSVSYPEITDHVFVPADRIRCSNSVLHFRMGMPSYRRTFWCHLCMYSSLQSDADPAFKSGGIAA